jgi:putative FmdB family regulatory protein
MPIYEYTCQTCHHTFDHLARNLQDIAKTCPACGAKHPRKGFSAFAARVPNAAAKACDSCHTNSSCPSAGKFGCGGGGCGGL